MSRSSKLFLACSALVYLGGCATIPYEPYAREVKRRPQDGGMIALHTDPRPEDRAKADTLMRSNCSGSTVKVVEEGEVVVGEKVDSTARKTAGTAESNAFSIGSVHFGNSTPSEDTSTQATKTQIKEWQITYSCVAETAPTAAAGAKTAKKSSKKNKG